MQVGEPPESRHAWSKRFVALWPGADLVIGRGIPTAKGGTQTLLQTFARHKRLLVRSDWSGQ